MLEKQSLEYLATYPMLWTLINNNILLDKLNCLCIYGIALKWFKSYLILRTRYVNLDNINSTKTLIIIVPQGSIAIFFCKRH